MPAVSGGDLDCSDFATQAEAQQIYDADTGPNDLQNFPTITRATTSSSTGDTTIDAFLDSVPSTQYVVRFYSNPRDTGEGKTLSATY